MCSASGRLLRTASTSSSGRYSYFNTTFNSSSKNYRMIVLDELNVVLKYESLPLDEVLAVLNSRPDALHIVVTGRHAKERMIEAADLVTEMRLVKNHYLKQQIKAKPGIEY